MHRTSLKIVGAQGQGVNSVGEMLGKGLKRAGYCVFGLREYMSVIKNGHSSYQLDVSGEEILSSQEKVDAVVSLNHHGIVKNLRDLKPGGVLMHQTPQWRLGDEDKKFIDENKITVLYLPSEEILKKLGAKPVLGNVLIVSVVWLMLKRPLDDLKELVKEQFGHKKDLLDLNFMCMEEGAGFYGANVGGIFIELPSPDEKWKNCLLISGSQTMGLGVIQSGCRAFFGYPMTPASPLMTFIADMQMDSKMVVKQSEDEITAVQMTAGAMHMGTRAMTATSGGGYDLMTETISMCGISETPVVIVLAQRPGPGTGLPTWSAQGDLLMAANCAHGEFPRLVMSVSDAQDSFSLMMSAFNYAEEFQIPVTVLTEKHVAESVFTVDESLVTRHSSLVTGLPLRSPPRRTKEGHWLAPHRNQSEAMISGAGSLVERGKLVVDEEGLKTLKSTDRYSPDAPDGISPRWLPGAQAETYCAQSYEHSPDGSFDETSANTAQQMEKRMRKMEALRERLEEPEIYKMENGKWKVENTMPCEIQNSKFKIQNSSSTAPRSSAALRCGGSAVRGADDQFDILFVSCGSNKNAVLDAIYAQQHRSGGADGRIAYLHYTYLWPLKTGRLLELSKKAKRVILVEGNMQGQLGMLIRQECGFEFFERILKYDGRAFTADEILAVINSDIPPKPEK